MPWPERSPEAARTTRALPETAPALFVAALPETAPALFVAALLVAAVFSPATALAASPTPDVVGDPRSSGQGPGLVGDPLAAIMIVVLIALVALGATLVYVRVTGGPGRHGAR